jgi:hypothetical protein
LWWHDVSTKRYLYPESSKVILDLARSIYNEENDRLKTTETKASIVLAFTGVLANFYMQYIFRRITLGQVEVLDVIFIIFNLTFIFLSGLFLLKSLTGQKFDQIDPSLFI